MPESYEEVETDNSKRSSTDDASKGTKFVGEERCWVRMKTCLHSMGVKRSRTGLTTRGRERTTSGQ